MSLRLHKEHGVNPTICQCYYCGEDKNQLALLGAGYKEEAPMHMVTDLEPCDKCKPKLAQGVTFIHCAEGGDARDPKPTGGYSVVKEKAAKKMFPDCKKVNFILESLAKQLGMVQ